MEGRRTLHEVDSLEIRVSSRESGDENDGVDDRRESLDTSTLNTDDPGRGRSVGVTQEARVIRRHDQRHASDSDDLKTPSKKVSFRVCEC